MWHPILLGALLVCSRVAGGPPPLSQLPLSDIVLPDGFSITLYVDQNVENARSLALSKAHNNGSTIVYASSNSGTVTAIVDQNSDGVAESACVLLNNLDNPEGLVWLNGSIYVATVTTVARYDNADSAALKNCTGLAKPVTLATPFPQQSDHEARHMELGPDGKLYITFGSPSNIVPSCQQFGDITQCSIVRMNTDGSDLQNWATGVRNSVGFDWHPDTEQFYFNIVERDLLGNNEPDDSMFTALVGNMSFGYPYCHWVGEGDPYMRDVGLATPLADNIEFNADENEIIAAGNAGPDNSTLNEYCGDTTPSPIQPLGPHVAALGLRFYTGAMFPAAYNGTIFVPEHGSWDRDPKIGYRVVNVALDAEGLAANHTIFAEGWLYAGNQTFWGRPVAMLQLPDDSILISDDYADAVYRISYEESSSGAVTTSSIGK